MVFSVFALKDITIPFTFSANTLAKSSQVNANLDSIRVPHNHNLDSIEKLWIRFTDLTSGDSTLTRLQVDTTVLGFITGNPVTDSLSGLVYFDSAITSDSVYTRAGIKINDYMDLRESGFVWNENKSDIDYTLWYSHATNPGLLIEGSSGNIIQGNPAG